MKKQAYIIIGLGYGDEGKGIATDYLCSKHKNPCVIRFNGGQQAGHTVVTRHLGKHVFSNIGSGTLRGAPTYWSEYCTFSPAYFLCEYQGIHIKPKLFLSPDSPVTTHYDVLYNRAIESTRLNNRHGSCGLGFGATLHRHYFDNLKLCAKDLFNSTNYREKLQKIRRYYQSKIEKETEYNFNDFDHDTEDEQFDTCINEISKLCSQNRIVVTNEKVLFTDPAFDTYIFEGAQGVLLDIDFGQKPHVTKSNTTTKNALKIINRNFADLDIDIQILYVTRAYQTKHGAGAFRGQEQPLALKNVETETNRYNEYQGAFGTSYLNMDDLNYALACDNNFSEGIKKNLLITCLDQIPKDELPISTNEKVIFINYVDICNYINCTFNTCQFSFSNCTDDLI